ncbi:MAG TPA: anaerobic ribonucleoside triphosphate reductase [Firmicutes bacterium]|nr:anaerobic ribonucleoside triphosphate reductase [Bacillota bacterium]
MAKDDLKDNVPFLEIRKRDGRITAFDKKKITEAIFKAARAVGGENYSLAEELTEEVISYLAARRVPGLIPTVEEIQDVVEKILIESGHARTSKAYILYRDKRTRIRETKSELMDVVKDILVEGNRNTEECGYPPAQKMQKIALAASQKYYLDNLLPPDIAQACRRGSFHIHRLGYYSKALDSLQIDLVGMMHKDPIFLEKSSPVGFYSALMAIAGAVQRGLHDLSGIMHLPFFDRFLGELMRGFNRAGNDVEVEAGLKGFLRYFGNLFCLSSGNNSKLGLGLGLDLTDEGRQCTRFFLTELLRSRERFGRIEVVFSLKKGINLLPEDPNYDLFLLALGSAQQGGCLGFCFLDTSFNNKKDGGVCYFANGQRIAENRHGEAKGEGRGMVGSLTINLPRLALSAGDEELFFVELDRLLLLGVRQLLHRYEVLTALRGRDLPFVMGKGHYMGSENLSPYDSIREALRNGVMSLGFIGLPEAVRFLGAGKGDLHREDHELFIRILSHMSKRILSFRDEYDLNFALSCVTGGGELKHFTLQDREEFGLIKGVNDRDLYSPGFVLFQEDEGLLKKIALEKELHRYCLGGYSSKVLNMPGSSPQGLAEFLRQLQDADIGYVEIWG